MHRLHHISSSEHLFLELLQVAVGTRETLSRVPTKGEWMEIKNLCTKHAVMGVGLHAIQKLVQQDAAYDLENALKGEWFYTVSMMKQTCEVQLDDIRKLAWHFAEEGFGSCLLKGMALTQMYPKGMVRNPGDIDIWVAREGVMGPLERRRKEVLKLCRMVAEKRPVFYHHTDLPVRDKAIEVHFTPSWMFAPWHNSAAQRFFEGEWQRRRFIRIESAEGKENVHMSEGFHIPSLEMDAVFILMHIYRHVFAEGVGLRQLLDYYYVLQQEGLDREKVLRALKDMGMVSFASAVMWVLREVLGMKEDKLLCPCDERRGKRLLEEIMMSGNFGKWDSRLANMNRKSLWSRTWENTKRNARLVHHYPSEAICAPIWRIWQKVWRRRNGY